MLTGCIDSNEMNVVSAADIASFLHKSHDYFMEYKFVHIRNNLLSALDECHTDINPAIINYFDDYIKQVKKHFAYEEKKVFPYIKSLSSGADTSSYKIDVFRRHHDEEVEMRLTELKNIILRFYSTTRPDRMYDVLVDLYTCEADLALHTDIENNILIPLVSKLENKLLK
jgi:regulator of cell morphogenesis and NO signaling